MAISIEQLLDVDLSFPGISFGYESWALESYLRVLEEQIEHARAQYRLRAERELRQTGNDLHHYEYGARLREIDEAADAQIPRFFRIGAVVSIWGIFESFVSDYALYVGKRENLGISFKDIRAENFRAQIEKYFEKVARIPIPWSAEEWDRLGQLQELRNVLAHRNGRLMDMPAESEKRIANLIKRMPEIRIEMSTIVVTPEYVRSASSLVLDAVGRFGQQIADKYTSVDRELKR